MRSRLRLVTLLPEVSVETAVLVRYQEGFSHGNRDFRAISVRFEQNYSNFNRS